jgi:hypothetical protein
MSQAADKAILTCALTGVLTNPQQHPVPVTPAQMAAEARDAFNAGASIMHVHLRSQEPGFGHMPSWDPDVAQAVCTPSAPPARASSSTSPPASSARTSAAPRPACSVCGPRSRPATPAR